MKTTCYFLFTVLLILFGDVSGVQAQRWSVEKARAWGEQNPWLNGVNYIPSDAINYTAMWDKTGFNPVLIDKELALAESLGMNCVRVVLQYAVYEDDPKYFLRTFEKFLSICHKHGIQVMPCFFDDCAFGVNTEPQTGKQPEPLEGWYAWAWSPSPGYTMVVDEREHPKLEKYVKDIMKCHKDDDRILLWDLYNEPTNTPMPERSLPLVRKLFRWALAIDPVQPLSMGLWNGYQELNDIIIANSDVITFHHYGTRENTERDMHEKLQYGRPVICTEWMNRPAGSYVMEILPMFKEQKVGSMLWGLVNGKTQTHLRWGHRPEHLPYTGEWQHDLYTTDFKPYRQDEIDLFLKLKNE